MEVGHRAGASGAWVDLRPYLVSLLKAWWGDAATEENEFCFHYLPRINGDHSHYAMMLKMLDGGVKGMFCVGQNPTVGSANSKLMRLALAKLDWLVVRDMQMIESATFWKDSPEHDTGEVCARDIATEVFFLPAADYVPAANDAKQMEAIRGDKPFILHPDGRGWLYAPSGLVDGPLPAHYEPQESPVPNPLYAQQDNPTHQIDHRPENPYHPTGGERGSDVFPYVITTYRLTEHHTAGGMSRTVPYLAELQPEFFCEVSPELAAERGLEHADWATIITARGVVEARVMVTRRIKPLRIQERTIHLVGVPYHWGGSGLVTGASGNELIPIALDNNVHISEYKVATCDIRPGRRPRGPARLELVEAYRTRAGVKP